MGCQQTPAIASIYRTSILHFASALFQCPLLYTSISSCAFLANMADSGDAKTTPSADQTASSDLRPAEHETNLVTNPLGDPSSEGPASDAQDTKTTTYTETAAKAASSAASTASAAATGVKDSVFSMFGGGAKKERKVEEDDNAKDEPSGSSKAQKKEEEDDVRSTLPIRKERPELTLLMS